MRHSEKLAYKYKFLREKIISSYNKGCKILNIVKIIFAVLFLIFTFIAVRMSKTSDDKTVWLICWIIVIFFDIGIFLIADYCKFLIKDKVIPYLLDDDQLEFGEYSIFIDDDEEKNEEGDED